jgi:hypothetical protein
VIFYRNKLSKVLNYNGQESTEVANNEWIHVNAEGKRIRTKKGLYTSIIEPETSLDTVQLQNCAENETVTFREDFIATKVSSQMEENGTQKVVTEHTDGSLISAYLTRVETPSDDSLNLSPRTESLSNASSVSHIKASSRPGSALKSEITFEHPEHPTIKTNDFSNTSELVFRNGYVVTLRWCEAGEVHLALTKKASEPFYMCLVH